MRTVLLGLLVIGTSIGLAGSGCHAEAARKGKRSVPAHPNRTAPDVTATIARPSPPSTPAPTIDDGEIPPPYKLPVASRARIRACGETWRDMKLAGTTRDDDWRDFALKCLASREPLPVR